MSNTMQSLVRICYKSGNVQEFWFDEFQIERAGSEVTSIKSKFAEPGVTSLMFGLDNIEAIFQVGSRMKESQ